VTEDKVPQAVWGEPVIPAPPPPPKPKTAAFAAALLTPDALPFRLIDMYGYRQARAFPTPDCPEGRLLATAGTDALYGSYVAWDGPNHLYVESRDVADRVLLTIAGCRA
jgi:hypothetical protein